MRSRFSNCWRLLVVVVAQSVVTTACSTASHGQVAHEPRPGGASVATEVARVVELRTTGIDLAYSVGEIVAKSGETLTIRYINDSDGLPHNVVLVRGEEDIRPVGIAALRAHATEYIPASESERIIAYSELAQSGEVVEFTFEVPPPGVYPYICTYSGHFTMMQGRLISTD